MLSTLKKSFIFNLRLYFLTKNCLLLYNLKLFLLKFYKKNKLYILSIWVFFLLKKKIKLLRRKRFNNKKKIKFLRRKRFNNKKNNKSLRSKYNQFCKLDKKLFSRRVFGNKVGMKFITLRSNNYIFYHIKKVSFLYFKVKKLFLKYKNLISFYQLLKKKLYIYLFKKKYVMHFTVTSCKLRLSLLIHYNYEKTWVIDKQYFIFLKKTIND